MRKEEDKFPLRMLLLISQLGITMMVPIFFCTWLGSMVVKKTGIDILILVFIIIGVMAGFRSCYHIIRRFTSLKSSSPEEKEPKDESD
ncbi:MAG: AtpZ/AtpI family protein [Eubacterium sp.]|nr:AtpZ/AtpI family protein [Eubacterium sp.]